MSTYVAPVKDMLFNMNELAGLEEITGLPGNEEVSIDLVEAILDEAGKFATEVVDPLNAVGDKQGNKWNNGVVTTADGFKEAYASFCETGWNGMPASTEFGGQGLPVTVSTAVLEMWKSASISFSLCQMLTLGAVEAIAHHASDELKATYLPNMVSGKWTGTMNLTEPQAGSDLALVRTRAEPQGDGTYKLFGTKIFITYGEHDLAENIIHFVLARVVGAPEGVKGISLFIVPKVLVNADGSLGARNDVHCVSVEHKMGIKASPTAVLQYGDHGGAIGTLVGQENRGLEYMFVMMNAARYGVGLQGIAIADRAYQKAVAYARDRVQSRPVDGSVAGSAPIIHHPDVRRMLMTMRALTEGCRAMASTAAARGAGRIKAVAPLFLSLRSLVPVALRDVSQYAGCNPFSALTKDRCPCSYPSSLPPAPSSGRPPCGRSPPCCCGFSWPATPATSSGWKTRPRARHRSSGCRCSSPSRSSGSICTMPSWRAFSPSPGASLRRTRGSTGRYWERRSTFSSPIFKSRSALPSTIGMDHSTT